MGTQILTNFDLETNLPIDSKTQKADLAARNAIPLVKRWIGLSVYVLSENKTYQLQGGITNAHWVDLHLGESIPTVDGIQFNVNASPQPNAEGLMQWNSADGTLDLGMKNGTIKLQLGQETFVKVKNESGALIENGKPVYYDGAASDGRPTIRLLSNGPHDDCLAVAGVTTEQIADGDEGYVTAWGKVRNIDTSALVEDALVYVGHEPGDLSSNPPEDEHHTVVIGICTKSDPLIGEIFVKRPIVLEPRELMETTGFHKVFESTVAWNRAEREFSITPIDPANGFSFYQAGVQYIKYATETIQIPDVEGIHYIFYNLGVLSAANNLTKAQVIEAIENYAIVAQIYWDATNKEELIVGEERHGFIMDGETHAYVHMVFGPQWIDGMAITSLNVAGTGAADADAQFGVDSGLFLDDDLDLVTDAIASTEGLPIFCYEGADENLRRYYEPGFSVLTDNTAGVGITGRLVYNKLDGGAWILETVPDGEFVLCHVFATNDPDQPYIAFVGRAHYASLVAAQTGAESEITPIINNSLKQEFTPVATIAFQTDNGYANTVQAKAVPSIAGGTYSDWRQTRSSGVAAGTGDHNDLPGKQGGAANEYYHLTNAAYTRANQAATAVLDGYLSSADWSTFNSKQAGNANLTNLSGLVYAAPAFVKMTGANAFTLDPSTYSLSSHNHAGVYAPVIHNLVDTTNHPVTGLTAGHVLKATAPTVYAFAALNFSEIANKPLYNTSVAVQSGFASDTYLVGSSIAIPTGSLKATTVYKCKFTMTKTAAGTAAIVINVRFGINGTTADASVLTMTFTNAQSAHVDTATFDLNVIFRTVGAGTSAVVVAQMLSTKDNTTLNRGHYVSPSYAQQVVGVGFDSTIPGSIIGISYNGGTSYVGTCEIVESSLENLV